GTEVGERDRFRQLDACRDVSSGRRPGDVRLAAAERTREAVGEAGGRAAEWWADARDALELTGAAGLGRGDPGARTERPEHGPTEKAGERQKRTMDAHDSSLRCHADPAPSRTHDHHVVSDYVRCLW